MTNKPDARMYETFALMARGRPLHKIEALCEKQKTVACSVLARMVEEAQDINTDYALTIRYSHESSRAADKARIAELESALSECAASLAWNCFGECRAVHDGPIMPAQMALEYARAALAANQKRETSHDNQ